MSAKPLVLSSLAAGAAFTGFLLGRCDVLLLLQALRDWNHDLPKINIRFLCTLVHRQLRLLHLHLCDHTSNPSTSVLTCRRNTGPSIKKVLNGNERWMTARVI